MYDDEKLEELRKRAAAIAEPIWETLRDIVRRVRGAGGITSTAEYQIYRAEQLGLAEKAIKAAIAEQLKISDAAIDMLFEELRDETVRFEENAELRQLVEAYGAVSKKAAAADYEG
ncbi:MAG: phage minor capsid protein, partial [Ruthenibacterium lactatiformans]